MTRSSPQPVTDRVLAEDLEWWLDLVPSLDWHFASSMPDAPHSYVVRGKTLHDPDFLRAVKVIRTFGQPGKFWDRTNVYLTVGDLKWWTMGDTLDGTIIINMATTEKVYGRQNAPVTKSAYHSVYDELACDYDARYTKAEDLRENNEMHRLVVRHFGAYAPRTLDVGCGTGLLLDLGVTAPGLYTGVDPSQAMLNELVRKHTRVTSLHPARMEDVLDQFKPRSFELICAWFGAASYLEPDTLTAVPGLCSDLTMLMCYRDGYLPDYYGPAEREMLAPGMAATLEAARSLNAATVFELNNFEVHLVES